MPNPENIREHTFDKHPEYINKKGRPISIKKQIRELLQKDGEIAIPKKALKRETPEAFIFKVPTQQAIALKYITAAMGKSNVSFRVIEKLIEIFDGKSVQPVALEKSIFDGYDKDKIEKLSDEIKNAIKDKS